MAIYMKYGAIDGDVTETKHQKWIEVHSLQWGVGRGIATPTGKAAHREASQPSVSEVTVTKEMDISSYLLFTEAVVGNVGKSVQIDICRTGDKTGAIVYATYTLSDALVSGYSVSSGGDRPTESVSVNFTKVEFKYTNFDGTNAAGTNKTVTYDLAAATQS